MAGELTLFKSGAVPSEKMKQAQLPTQRLDDGVSAGFPRVSYKGSKWGIRYQGAYTPIQARMPDGTLISSPFLDVVLLKASGHPNKAWYAGAYSEGDQVAPPDCWSSNGVTPDAGAPNKQSRTCAGCQHNVWGSKVNRDTGQATRGKACMDSKRMAVVPVGDIENKVYGGPMMLSVPPSSLKRLGPYQNMLEANGFHYAGVWTRITFEPESAYPLFVFDAIAPLNDPQFDLVLKMIDHPMIERILDAETVAVEAWDESAQSVHSSIGAAQPGQGNQQQTGTVVQLHPTPAHTAAVTPAAVTPPPSTPATPAPVQMTVQPEDDLKPPGFLQGPRASGQPQPVTPPPPSAPSPSAPPAEPEPEGEEPQAEQPATPAALPAGVVLPPGMTAEMAAAFMQQFGAQAQAAPKRGRKRTPPVSPATTDTSVAGQALPSPAAPGAPQMVMPEVPPAPASAGDPVGQIMSTIAKLV